MSESKALTAFQFEGMSEVRVLTGENGEPLFVAKDVAVALGYSRPNDAVNLHCKGTAQHRPLQTAGGMQELRIIDEPDMYRLVFGSELESAKKFQDWVTSEVLPSIRKTGGYGASRGCVQSLIAAAVSIERKSVAENARQLRLGAPVDDSSGVRLKRGLTELQWADLLAEMQSIAQLSEDFDKAYNSVYSHFSRYFSNGTGNGSGGGSGTGIISWSMAVMYLDLVRSKYRTGYEPEYRRGVLVIDDDLV